MIAHQWRQPLSAISSTSIDMKVKLELEMFDLTDKEDRDRCHSYFLDSLDSIEKFIQGLTHTIDDFRDFYKQNKELESCSILIPVKRTLSMVKASFSSQNIKIIENLDELKNINMYPNEIVQVILNIVKNAQDNFKEKDIKEAVITITSKNIKDGVVLEISDNGGGIPKNIIDNIFDPYFSTKKKKNGTGLGLYMSKMIIEKHHNGIITAENIDDGVLFKVKLFNKPEFDS